MRPARPRGSRDRAGTAAGALAERCLKFLLDLADELRRQTGPAEVTSAAAAVLGRHVGAARAGYGEIDKAGEVVSIERDGAAVASLAGEARILNALGPAVIAELNSPLIKCRRPIKDTTCWAE